MSDSEEKYQSKNQLSKEYKEHKIFQELNTYIKYYDFLSFSTFSWVSVGVENMINFDNRIFTSIKGTLDSIQILLEKGKINDAFSLARRYHDNVVINTYALLYLETNHNLENFTVEKINNWVNNKEKLPEYKVMNSYIRSSKKVKNINNLLFSTKYYTNMRQRLNDHTHYNSFQYMFYNDNQMFDVYNNRINFLEQLSIDLRNIFIKHFVWLFSIKDNYMMSSDYIDYLDMGMTPPENSQYWVAPLIQEIFDEIIKQYRPDLADELKKSTYMELK